MKIVVSMTIELPVEVMDKEFDIDFWLEGSSLCKNSLLPPNEYLQCVCAAITEIEWRLPKVEDQWLFEKNQLWESGHCKPKEGIDC